MAYTGTADGARGLLPVLTRPDRASRRRSLWRRAFARALAARRQVAEREVAEFARLSGLKLPESAKGLRGVVSPRAAPWTAQ